MSSSAQLRELEVGFRYPASLPTQSKTSPPLRRTTFPSLCLLEFHGASEYLEEFVSQVDIPSSSLSSIKIQLFHQIFFEIREICHSIPLLSTFKSPTKVYITLDPGSVFVTFEKFQEDGNYPLQLQTNCERLDWQLSFVTQVLNQLSPLLEGMDVLHVSLSHYVPSGEDVDPMQWLELFQPFASVRTLYVDRKSLDIVQALVTEDMAAGVLPELTQLFVLGGYNPAVVEAAEQFVAARKHSGRTIDFSTWHR